MFMAVGEKWAQLGSLMAAFKFAWTMFQRFFPNKLQVYTDRLVKFSSPYIHVRFPEYSGWWRDSLCLH